MNSFINETPELQWLGFHILCI